MKEITVIFFCTWKFAATFPLAIYAFRMSVFETLIYTNLGGIIGAVLFLYFSDFLIKMWNKYWPERLMIRSKNRKKFTRANRRFVTIKIKYGLPGIVILSPVILSIPLGAFLAAKYYGARPKTIIWLVGGQIMWSLIYTLFYTQLEAAMG